MVPAANNWGQSKVNRMSAFGRYPTNLVILEKLKYRETSIILNSFHGIKANLKIGVI